MRPSEVDLDRIMQRIREEVARRKSAAGADVEPVSEFASTTATAAGSASAASSPGPDPLPRLPESEGRIERKDAYRLEDFLGFHDEDFVRNAYRGILRRESDATGLARYLDQLRAGRMAKTEILGRLRFSAEGRAAGVPVRGLALPFALRTARRTPLVGNLLGMIQDVIRLPQLVRRHERLEAAFFHRQQELRRQVNVVAAHIEQRIIENHKAAKADIERVRREVLDELASVARPAETDVLLAKDDRLLDPLYVSFEDRFRGTRDDIKKRVEVYVPIVRQAGAGTVEAPILDVGCGRGEWLEVLEDNGLVGHGVDLNHVMARDCRARGLEVIERDGIDYLRDTRPESFGAVTGIHIIEHLPFRRLIALIDETLRVLRPGGVAIFETPNPENLIVGACTFYYDFTHVAPLPPDPVAFLLNSRGFSRVEIRRLHRNTDAAMLAPDEAPLHPRLSQLLYGEQDYAAIAYKL